MEREKLPKYFVREFYVNAEIQQLEQQVEGVNRALQTFAAEDLPIDLEFLGQHAQTQADFRAWLKEKEKAYVSPLFLPRKEKERIHLSFVELADRVENARNTIGTFIAGAKFPIKQELDGSVSYDWDKVREVLAKRNTYIYTPEDKEYFQVLQDAKDALLRIQAWEEEHVYAPIGRTFGNVGQLLTTEFSGDWFAAHIGIHVGKSSKEALKMIREQEEED